MTKTDCTDNKKYLRDHGVTIGKWRTSYFIGLAVKARKLELDPVQMSPKITDVNNSRYDRIKNNNNGNNERIIIDKNKTKKNHK